jgi:XisH protein
MPAKDIYHNTVKNALTKDGWTITHDPLRLPWGPKDLYVDLGAEHLLGAAQGERKIAVEIKSFVGPSLVTDLEHALGQYILYHDIMTHVEPDRELYLAIRRTIFLDLFAEPIGRVLLDNRRLKLIVFDPRTEVIVQWIP